MYTQLYSNLDVFKVGILINPAIKLWGEPLTKLLKTLKINQLYIPFSWLLIIGLIISASYYNYHVENYFVRGVKTSISFVFFPTLTAIFTGIFIFLNAHQNYLYNRYNSSILVFNGNPAQLCEWLGILSFGIYVWHLPVADSGAMNVFTNFSPSLNYWANIGICFFLTLMLSLTTYYFVERPFLLNKKYKNIK